MKLVKSWRDVAVDLAAHAASTSLLLVGPVGRHDDFFVRPVIFAGRSKACIAVAVAFGYETPTAADDAEFVSILRSFFSDVRLFNNDAAMGRGAARVALKRRRSVAHRRAEGLSFLQSIRRGRPPCLSASSI